MRLLILLTFLFSISCSFLPKVGEDYKEPEISTPAIWQGIELNKFEALEIAWWKHFDDKDLCKIILIAIENNHSLKIAQSRVLEARANFTISNSDLMPSLGAKASATRQNNYFNPVTPSRRPIANLFDLGFDATWEIDLFGGNYRAKESAKALWEAAEHEKNYVLITLISEVARNYFNLRLYQNHIEIQKEINHRYAELIEIAKEQNNAGLTSEIDLNNIRIEALENQKELSNLEFLYKEAQHNLEFLLGYQINEMENFFAKKNEIPTLRKYFIANTPLDVLQNRPDILQAERQFASAVALKGYSIAQVFPKISLSGFFGFFSNSSGNLVQASSKAFSTSVQLQTPILDFGGVMAGLKMADERKKQALIAYEEKINSALKEVQIALINFSKQQERLSFINSIHNSQKMINEFNLQRFEEGLISKIELIKSEIDLYKKSQNKVSSQIELAQKAVTLYKSIGGGWQNFPKKSK